MKPGSIYQEPLYSCVNCYEDYSFPAEDLRVYEDYCWCYFCWQDTDPDLPEWEELEPFVPYVEE